MNAPRRLTANVASHVARWSSSSASGRAIPALLTRMSIGPNAAFTASTIVPTSFGVETSALATIASPPAARISVTTASGSSSPTR